LFKEDLTKLVYHHEQSRLMVVDEKGQLHFFSPAVMQQQSTIINYRRLIHLLDMDNVDEIDMFKFLPN